LGSAAGLATVTGSGGRTSGVVGTAFGLATVTGEIVNGAPIQETTGTAGGTSTVVGRSEPVDEGGSKGGWDPYAYKRRNKRRDKLEDVRAFMSDVLGKDMAQAPVAVVEQVEEAKQAAREVLAIAPTGLDAETRAATTRALEEINEFYRLVREQVRVRRAEQDDEDDDDDFLLLAA
jgi:hypothetical protein